ncbi:hypothetical protein [Endozoicomonas atrinae]|uniref:hypothetical protein n=1 Tax=Endozoicomonas atrinae TaxID=1333660 RepID=UPI00082610C3|nr:hypothetical protein [Endozoicomonas atrinae]
MSDDSVYITQYNFNSFLKKIDLEKVKLTEKSALNRNLSAILNFYELRWLKLYQTAMEEPGEILKEAYIKQVSVDNDRYVYYTPPAYHKDSECINLKSRFENVFIPEPVRVKGHDAVVLFRELYKKNVALYENNRPAFMALVELKLKVKIFDLEHVEADNSGSQKLDGLILLSPQEIEYEIDKLLEEMNTFRHSSTETENEVKKFGYATYKAKKHDNNGNFSLIIDDKESDLHKWHNYKKSLNRLVQEYCRATLNPEFEFSAPILEEIGFRACQSCCGDAIKIEAINNFFSAESNSQKIIDSIPF